MTLAESGAQDDYPAKRPQCWTLHPVVDDLELLAGIGRIALQVSKQAEPLLLVGEVFAVNAPHHADIAGTGAVADRSTVADAPADRDELLHSALRTGGASCRMGP